MGTPSIIIARTSNDGLYKGFRCHYDGYPAGVGSTLNKDYTDEQNVEKLMYICRCGCKSLPEAKDLCPGHEDVYDEKGKVFNIAEGIYMENVYDELDDYAYVYLYDIKNGEWLISPDWRPTLDLFKTQAAYRKEKEEENDDISIGKLSVN